MGEVSGEEREGRKVKEREEGEEGKLRQKRNGDEKERMRHWRN